jgi:CBS-domain-containing membrane protein
MNPAIVPDIDHIAEFADSSIRVLNRQGSLVGVPGSYGLKRWLYSHYGNRGNAAYTFTGSLIVIALSSTWAYAFKQPLIFPSLGATALLIFETPMSEIGSPRNTIVGHYVAVACAALTLWIFGLLHHPSTLVEGVSPARIGAIALAVALTGASLRLLRSAHPPAGATTIIVSAGLLHTWHNMGIVLIGVAIVTITGWGLNRLLGVPAPAWAAAR